MTKEKPKTEEDLVGKNLSIQLLDRSESEWTSCKCIGVTDKIVAIEWENRGCLYQNYFPWSNISHISIRYSNASGGDISSAGTN